MFFFNVIKKLFWLFVIFFIVIKLIGTEGADRPEWFQLLLQAAGRNDWFASRNSQWQDMFSMVPSTLQNTLVTQLCNGHIDLDAQQLAYLWNPCESKLLKNNILNKLIYLMKVEAENPVNEGEAYFEQQATIILLNQLFLIENQSFFAGSCTNKAIRYAKKIVMGSK